MQNTESDELIENRAQDVNVQKSRVLASLECLDINEESKRLETETRVQNPERSSNAAQLFSLSKKLKTEEDDLDGGNIFGHVEKTPPDSPIDDTVPDFLKARSNDENLEQSEETED